jgi:hypothetical protein
MYPCFANIPPAICQQAFTLIATHLRALDYWSLIDDETYCPFGVVNRELLASDLIDEERKYRITQKYAGDFSDVALRVPYGPATEVAILASFGIDADEASVERFMRDVDDHIFPDLQSLAEAMGARYEAISK